jgi:hypothetical protein
MSEKKTTSKTEVKQTTEKSDASKTTNDKSEVPKASDENKPQETANNSGDAAKKSDAPKSASQTAISHFSSVSTPEYRSGWDKIFGKSDAEQPTAEPPTKYEQRKALVAEQWVLYQASKNPKHLATICKELPFFEHPEVGEEIANLLLNK